MKLSVILPCYNHARLLPRALTSLLDQSLPPDEIIVIDDASTDNTPEVVAGFASRDKRIRPMLNPGNLGTVSNCNRGIAIATGEFLHFAAADDWVLPRFYEKTIRQLEIYSSAAYCSTRSQGVTEAGEVVGIREPRIMIQAGLISPAAFTDLYRDRGNWIRGNACVYRRRILDDEGGFPEQLLSFSDGFMGLFLGARYGACYVPEILAACRIAPDSYSRSTATDLESGIAILRIATRLMNTKYRDCFSDAFIGVWQREWLSIFRSRAPALTAAQVEIILETLLDPSRMDHVYLDLLRRFPGTRAPVTRLYRFLTSPAPLKFDMARHLIAVASRRFLFEERAEKT